MRGGESSTTCLHFLLVPSLIRACEVEVVKGEGVMGEVVKSEDGRRTLDLVSGEGEYALGAYHRGNTQGGGEACSVMGEGVKGGGVRGEGGEACDASSLQSSTAHAALESWRERRRGLGEEGGREEGGERIEERREKWSVQIFKCTSTSTGDKRICLRRRMRAERTCTIPCP